LLKPAAPTTTTTTPTFGVELARGSSTEIAAAMAPSSTSHNIGVIVGPVVAVVVVIIVILVVLIILYRKNKLQRVKACCCKEGKLNTAVCCSNACSPAICCSHVCFCCQDRQPKEGSGNENAARNHGDASVDDVRIDNQNSPHVYQNEYAVPHKPAQVTNKKDKTAKTKLKEKKGQRKKAKGKQLGNDLSATGLYGVTSLAGFSTGNEYDNPQPTLSTKPVDPGSHGEEYNSLHFDGRPHGVPESRGGLYSHLQVMGDNPYNEVSRDKKVKVIGDEYSQVQRH
jgi:hypothetical protein